MSKPKMPRDRVLYNLKPKGGVGEKSFLSCTEKLVDLWGKDDDSGRQKWYFRRIGIEKDIYNIEVYAGAGRDLKYLSCRKDGLVDLYDYDDKSGRQQWVLTPLNNGAFHIKIFGGTNKGEKYLSCRKDGLVDLYDYDDKSGRQQWQLLPEDIEISKVEFDDNLHTVLSKPDFVVTQEVPNDSDAVQNSEVTFEKKATVSSSFQREHGFTFSIEAEKKFSFAGVDTGSIKISASTTNTWTYGTSESQEDTRTYKMPVTVPPRSKIIATARVTQSKIDVPYTAIGYSKKSGEKFECKGIWTGVSVGKITYSFKQFPLT